MKKEKSKLSLLKEVVQQLTPQQQAAVKGGSYAVPPTAKHKTVKTKTH